MPEDMRYDALRGHALRAGGLVTLGEAAAAGLSESEVATLVRRGSWLKVAPGLRRIADCPIDDEWRDRLRATMLVTGAGTVAAGHSAAQLLGMVGAPPTGRFWVAVPPDRHPERRPGVRVMRTPVRDKDVVEVDGVRTTAPLRTVLDCARYGDPLSAVCLIESAARQALVSVPELFAAVTAIRGKRGSVRARAALRRIDLRSESPLETKARLLLVDAGFRYPRVQRPFGPGDARRIDLAYLARPGSSYRGVAIEIDGRAVHAKEEAFHRDPVRHIALEEAGWLVRRFTDRNLADIAYVCRTVRKALERAGCN